MNNFIDFIDSISETYTDKIAFEIRRKYLQEKVLYKELPGLISQFIQFFDSLKIKSGDNILIWGLNCPEYAVSILACFCSGRVAVPVDYRSTEELLQKIIDQTQPKCILVSKYIKHDFLRLKVTKIIELESLFDELNKFGHQRVSFEKSTTQLKNSDSIAEIVYTSGTTGIPKGVVLTQKNILTNMLALNREIPRLDFYQTISILPLSHMFEQVIGLFLMLYRGGMIIYLTRVNSTKVLETLTENRVTHLSFVPQMFSLFLNKIRQRAFEKNRLTFFDNLTKYSGYFPLWLKKIIFNDIHRIFGNYFYGFLTGGAPLNLKVARVWTSMGFRIFEGYGATEVVAGATINTPVNIKLGSAGKPLEGVEIKLDRDGQIIIDSPAVSQGYFKDKVKTEKFFRSEGYYTGDIGRIDRDGYLYILGRDVFKIVLSNGEKIYAEDLEAKINAIEGINDSCVLEYQHEGESQIFAYILPEKLETKPDVEGLVRIINASLEPKQQIRHYAVWPEEDFPRTHTLKIDRPKVRSFLYHKTGNQPASAAPGSFNNSLDPLEIIARVANFQKSSIKPENLLSSDLDMDSVARIELVAQLEEYLGIEIPEADITVKTTVQDILDKCAGKLVSGKIQRIPTWQYSSIYVKLSKIFRENVLYPLHALLVRLEVRGEKNISELKNGFIVIVNHPGPADEFCVMRILHQHGFDKLVFLATRKLWGEVSGFNKFLRFMMEFNGGMPLYEDGIESVKILQKTADLLEKGYYLIWPPTGTMKRSDKIDPFRTGIGYIAQQIQVPLVMFKIDGYENIWKSPRSGIHETTIRELLPQSSGKVTVTIGKPFRIEKAMSPHQLTKLLERKFNDL